MCRSNGERWNQPHPDGQRRWWCVVGTSQPKAPKSTCISQRVCDALVSSDESFTCGKRGGKPEQCTANLNRVCRLLTQAFLSQTFNHHPLHWILSGVNTLENGFESNLPVLVSSPPCFCRQAWYRSPQDLPQPSQSSRKPPYYLWKGLPSHTLLCFHSGRPDHCSKAAVFLVCHCRQGVLPGTKGRRLILKSLKSRWLVVWSCKQGGQGGR